jgi:hypothetical protein
MAFVVVMAALIVLAQACGGGSASKDASPTATSSPAAAAGRGTPPPGFTPGAGPSFTFGGGPNGAGLVIVGASEELAEFLDIPLEQLESELSEEGATPASVAEAHDRTRDELKTFYTEQQEAQLSEAVATGDMSQEDADSAMQRFAAMIDDMIDGNVPAGGGPGAGGFVFGGPGLDLAIGGASEELAEFLGISQEQLESELDAEGATPASVAEAHGRTREELKTFYTDQMEWQLIEAVAAGDMSQDEADSMMERFATMIDAMIDGNMPSGGPQGMPPQGAPPGQ